MKKSMIIISILICAMLTSCGTDAKAAVNTKTAEIIQTQDSAGFDSIAELTECCISYEDETTVTVIDSASGCCSPVYAVQGGCCD